MSLGVGETSSAVRVSARARWIYIFIDCLASAVDETSGRVQETQHISHVNARKGPLDLHTPLFSAGACVKSN